MVKKGTTLLKGVNVEITRLETAYPALSDKDNRDIGPKIRYLADLLEAIRDNTSAGGTTDVIKWGGTSVTGRDITGDIAKLQNLDVALTVLARLYRWGRDGTPVWIHGDEVTAPAAGTELVSHTVASGKTGYIYGFFISAGEANDFKVNWTSGGSAKSRRIPFSGSGALQYADFIAFNEGLGADAGTKITITNVNDGGAGVIYQAALLIMEV